MVCLVCLICIKSRGEILSDNMRGLMLSNQDPLWKRWRKVCLPCFLSSLDQDMGPNPSRLSSGLAFRLTLEESRCVP